MIELASLTDLTPTKITDYGLLHVSFATVMYLGHKGKRWWRRHRQTEKYHAYDEHYNPHFKHSGKHPKLCNDGKCAIL